MNNPWEAAELAMLKQSSLRHESFTPISRELADAQTQIALATTGFGASTGSSRGELCKEWNNSHQ